VKRLLALAAALTLLGAGAASASPLSATDRARLAKKAAPKGPLGHSGRWITDRTGRVVILHGLNMVYKRPPYAPDATGFGADDAAFLRRFGFNTIRLGVIYGAVEPQPGRYDERYLNRIARTERHLARRGIFSQLDFHQDLYNEKFGGEGWPDWAVLDDGQPAEPLTGFPGSYVSSPGLNRAFDNFWENEAGPGGVRLQARYARAWRRVAARFRKRPRMMGYDLLNEPWPGSIWSSCANPDGCPAWDTGPFTAFYRRVIKQIRKADRRNLIWYEPHVEFNFGSDSNVDGLKDRRLGFSFHVYCLTAAFGGGNSESCQTFDEMVFDNADKQARQTGSALLLTEFGATDENDVNGRIVDSSDEHMVSWQYWHYCGCDDPTTQAGPGDTQALVRDPSKPPRGKNIKRAKLRVLVRPYPQVIAGTPIRFDFDPETKEFELVYSTRRASGKGRFRRGLTDVFVPRLHYRRGYAVRAKGAEIASRHRRQHLILRSHPRAKRVRVVVTPRD
jgi:endoglycosylceramidase